MEDFESGRALEAVAFTAYGAGLGVVDSTKQTIAMVTSPVQSLKMFGKVLDAAREKKKRALIIQAIKKAAQEYLDSAVKNPKKFQLNTGKIAGNLGMVVIGTQATGAVVKAA